MVELVLSPPPSLLGCGITKENSAGGGCGGRDQKANCRSGARVSRHQAAGCAARTTIAGENIWTGHKNI